MKQKILSALVVIILYIALAIAAVITGCPDSLTEEQTDELMEQYAKLDSVYEPFQAKYLPCCQIASCKVFGTESDGDYLYVYADILDGTYVLFEGKAYSQSGGHMPVKMKVKSGEGSLKLIDTQYPEDGEEYWESIKAMYPRKYFWQYEYYYMAKDEYLYNMLEDSHEKKLKKLWGKDVVLERDNVMELDEDGSYQIWKVKNENAPAEEFEVVIINQGKL